MARVWALWYGGTGYAPGGRDDIETFDSELAAKDALLSRRATGHWARQPFDFVNRERELSYTPVVEADSEMWLWTANPTDSDELYPDFILKLGPRGGVVKEPT